MQITFDTNMFLHNLDIISKYPLGKLLENGECEHTVVVLLPVIAELDNIKINSSNQLLKYKGRKATKFLKESIDLGLIKPLDYIDCGYDIKPLNRYEVVDDLIISICKEHSIKLITMDYNVYLKCKHLNIDCELYEIESKIENPSMIYKGVQDIHVSKEVIDEVYERGFTILSSNEFNENEYVTLIDYSNPKHTVSTRFRKGKLWRIKFSDKSYWGLKPLSLEQRYALDLLDDDSIRIVTMTGEAGTAKAQPNNTPIPTPLGWKKLGELEIGDYVFDRLGNPTKVLGVYPQGVKPTYKITFSDGRTTLCADEHLWDVYTSKTKDNKYKNKNQKPMTLSTLEIIDKLKDMNKDREGKNKKWLYIQNNGAVQYTKKHLPIDPYALGVLLGDGCLTCSGLQVSSNEEDIIKKVANNLDLTYKKAIGNNYTWVFSVGNRREIKESLKNMGLLVTAEKKHIPNIYLESSIEDRMELLKGLMDTDGNVGKKNRLSFSTTSKKLKDDFMLLCRSLGFITSENKPQTSIERKNPLYTVRIQTNEKIFSSLKHESRWQKHIDTSIENIGIHHNQFIAIKNIERVEDQENTCIYVDNEEHLYQTENFIVTHNTILAMAVGLEKKVNHFGKGNLYITRPPVALSKRLALGFKKGDTLEKAIDTLGCYATNLEKLATLNKGENRKIDGNKLLLDMLEQCEIRYLNLESILGMSFSDDDYIIVDEAELLTKDEMKAIVTRGGKIVILGDVEQGGDSKIDYDDSGLLHLIDVGKKSELIGHITLQKVYRSEICEEINKIW